MTASCLLRAALCAAAGRTASAAAKTQRYNLAVRLQSLLMVAATAAGPPLLLGGCVQRTISITSEPDGALVWLNDREVGRTPLEVGFVHYGVYDVRLEREGYETLLTSGDAKTPWWETVGIDLFAEMLPADLHSRVEWHYVLRPLDDDPAGLQERAHQMREALRGDGAGPPAP